MLDRLIYSFTLPLTGLRTATVFCKAVYVYIAIKIILMISILDDITKFHVYPRPKAFLTSLILIPGLIAHYHVYFFLLTLGAIILVSLFIRLNVFTSFIIAWFTCSFYFLSLPVANGSDQIMLTLAIFAVPLSAWPTWSGNWETIQTGLYRGALMFCRFFVVSVYAISGLDKIGSSTWRTGKAITLVTRLPYSVNPSAAGMIPTSSGAHLALAWATIAFELLFPFLVWYASTRYWILAAGVVFHLIIGYVLSLPDFSAIMIVSYLIFVSEADWDRILIALRLKSRDARKAVMQVDPTMKPTPGDVFKPGTGDTSGARRPTQP